MEDSWREAILAERASGKVHEAMKRGLALVSKREEALILGDASLVQSNYLLENGFAKIVDVDISPTLLDDDLIAASDTRVERVVSAFDAYTPPAENFDFIYGKSIAFNPKKTVLELLKNLQSSLKEEGIFCAVWAAEGDSFRPIYYTEEELKSSYAQAGLEIMTLNHPAPEPNKGLVKPGTRHIIEIIAKRNS